MCGFETLCDAEMFLTDTKCLGGNAVFMAYIRQPTRELYLTAQILEPNYQGSNLGE